MLVDVSLANTTSKIGINRQRLSLDWVCTRLHIHTPSMTSMQGTILQRSPRDTGPYNMEQRQERETGRRQGAGILWNGSCKPSAENRRTWRVIHLADGPASWFLMAGDSSPKQWNDRETRMVLPASIPISCCPHFKAINIFPSKQRQLWKVDSRVYFSVHHR